MTGWRCLAILWLAVFGALRQPLERAIGESLEERHFREANVLAEGSVREQLGQLGMAAALGGFRSFLATLYELRAFTAYYEDLDYESVESNYHIATQLQPREAGYWNMAAWMMGSNARRYYLTLDLEHSEAERAVLARLSERRGKRFLDDGLTYNPDDITLIQALGNHLALRQEDYCAAAEAFARAADLIDGPSQAARHHAIYLAHCAGREREAYLRLRTLTEAIERGESPVPGEWMPISLILHMRYLEGVLGIPEADGFPTRFDFAAFYRRLRSRLPRGREGGEFDEVTAIHRIRLQRLEEILEIPRGQRIPFQERLRPQTGSVN